MPQGVASLLVEMNRTSGDPVLFVEPAAAGFRAGALPTVSCNVHTAVPDSVPVCLLPHDLAVDCDYRWWCRCLTTRTSQTACHFVSASTSTPACCASRLPAGDGWPSLLYVTLGHCFGYAATCESLFQTSSMFTTATVHGEAI